MKLIPEYQELFEGLLDTYPNYPKEGVAFKDLSRVYSSPEAMRTIERLSIIHLGPHMPDCVIGCDARGFIS